ncbi:MAG: hypothetical protein RIB60_05615 [Phycisphaerales bacterium]
MRPRHALVAALSLMLAAPAFAAAPEKQNNRPQKTAQRTARPAPKPVTRPAARPAPNRAARPAARPAPRQTTTRPAPQRREQARPASRPAQRSISRPQTNRPQRDTARPSSRPITRPSARPTDRPSTRPQTRPAPRPTTRPTTRPATRPQIDRSRPITTRPDRGVRTIRRPAVNDRDADRTTTRPGTRPGTRTFTRPTDRPDPSTSTRPGVRPNRPAESRPAERPVTRPQEPRPNTRPAPDRGAQKQRLAERRQRLGERPDRPGIHRGDELRGRRGGDRGGHTDHDGHDGHRGKDKHHHHHHYYDHHHHYYSHGYSHHWTHYSLGLWISFRAHPFYYCPTYREVSYVYVSPRYTSHRYYGLTTKGTNADRAISALEAGWSLLEQGRYTSARSAFARAASYERDWGLPKIGYAIALAASGNDSSARHFMTTAFEEDPYAALEVPYSPELDELLILLDDHYTDRAIRRISERDSWFMAAAFRLMLGDADAAADAAFASESVGGQSYALDGLFDVLAGSELAD